MQKHLRLRHQAAFERVRTHGTTWKQPALLVNVVENDLPYNRYGFIITKRIGKAVVRNHLRRQLRACVGQLHQSLKQGFDIVLVTRSPILDLDFQRIDMLLHALMQQAGLWIPIA